MGFLVLDSVSIWQNAFNTPEVVPFTFAVGIPIDKVALLDQETRNHVGKKLLELTLMELFIFRFMQASFPLVYTVHQPFSLFHASKSKIVLCLISSSSILSYEPCVFIHLSNRLQLKMNFDFYYLSLSEKK